MYLKKEKKVLKDLRCLGLSTAFGNHISYFNLRMAYLTLVKKLNKMNYGTMFETIKTRHESVLFSKIKKKNKTSIYTSVWIGHRNIDIFIPGLTSFPRGKGEQFSCNRKLRGLAIEVDGSIHNRESKIKKDNSKYDILFGLRIGVYTVENKDLGAPQVRDFISGLSKIPRLDTRARMRLWRDIYLSTLIAHKDLINLRDYCEENSCIVDKLENFYV